VVLASGVTGSSSGFALAVAVVVALIYLLVLRVVDLNEREPLWALSLCLVLGAVAALLVPVFSHGTSQVSAWPAAISQELGKFVALLGAMAIFNAIGRLRGWSDVNDVLDGVVYGAAVGLGFATGAAFVHQLSAGTTALGATVGSGTILWTTLLSGLQQGIFGGLLGAGFGKAVTARSDGERWGYPVAGLLVAIIVHGLYNWLAHGGALGGGGNVRSLLALIIPLVLLVALVVFGLGREKEAIGAELSDEAQSGVVTPEDLVLLQSPTRRRQRYVQELFKGNFDGWMALRTRQNRQVQLALAKRRAAGQTDPQRRAEALAEADRIRAAITLAGNTPTPAGATGRGA
jgi:RsiW-degrading membrane proteinase PrsW (M82 family)